MKYLSLLVLNLLIATSFACDKPSTHGMLMLGKSKIYLSHLPMFHTPHDYQVIVEVEISEIGKKSYFESLDASSEKVYTLVPETFVLPEMIKNPKPFKAQIFKGHFEREGVMIADKVTVEIKKVIYFKKFDPKKVRAKQGQYILFGDNEEKFLAHEISIKPDFDQILKVESDVDLKNGFTPVVIKSVENTEPLQVASVIEASVPFQITTPIYLETGDLSF